MTKQVSQIFAAGVLAGAYRAGRLEAVLLKHGTSNGPVREGRLKREYGEALCDRKINLVDEVIWEPASEITCPKCKEIVARHAQ